jgi:hypothetical protein
MGAFFLFEKNTDFNQESVRRVFEKKGFDSPVEYELGSFALWLYEKQVASLKNACGSSSGAKLFAVGTPIYQGFPYKDGLKKLLYDYENDGIDFSNLFGNYCLIFSSKGKIQFLLDPLHVLHIFTDNTLSRFSSSFLAVLASFNETVSLNRNAFYEKLTTGYIVGSETLVSEIQRVTTNLELEVKTPTLSFLRSPIYPLKPVSLYCDDFEQSVQRQVAALRSFVANIKPFVMEHGCDLGISGGYDSRLLMLLAVEAGLPLSLHTHHTKGVHDKELEIVERIASHKQLTLRVRKTLPIERHCEEDLFRILEDGLYYYDARNGDNTGAISETYTRRYKKETLGQNGVRLNGEGGEIFRNYYFTSRNRIDFPQWMIHHICYPFSEWAFKDKDIFRISLKRNLEKMEKELDAELFGKVSLMTVRRYYAELRLPQCEGINHSADNQICFFITPFIEPSIIKKSYEALPFIGIGGRFQSAMISYIDKTTADIQSHYGFPISKESTSHRLKCLLRGYIPDRFWNARQNYRIRFSGLGKSVAADQQRFSANHKIIREIEEALFVFFPEIEKRYCFRNPDMRKTALYMGSFLREFGGAIH